MHTCQNWWECSLWFRMPLSKLVKFSFQTMKSMGVKKLNLIELAQKNYASGVGVTCMYANFGERGLFGFGDKTSFLICQNSLVDHGLVPRVDLLLLVHSRKKIECNKISQKNSCK